MKINLFLTAGGIFYGAILIIAAFVKTRFTEVFRIDVFISPNTSEKTRLINLFAGVCFTGYSIYSSFTS